MGVGTKISNILRASSVKGVNDASHAGGITLEHVSKSFRKRTLVKRKNYTTIKTSLLSAIFSKRFPRENWLKVLDDVSLEIRPGQALGVIGRNGSGKSTLLKLIAGIYRPNTGKINVHGRVSALIELGAGFHPDFTGRENIYLGGVMYGLTRKEIDERFDAIVDYAKLRDFIDDPVRTYSSGMYMRLGFALAVHTDPDILLIDEVLAVGDASFIHRCQETIADFKRRGKTLLVVTHDLDAVSRWCDEAVWIDQGSVYLRGEPRWVIDRYLQEIEECEERDLQLVNVDGANVPAHSHRSSTASSEHRWGNRDVEITHVSMVGHDGQQKWLFHEDDEVVVDVEFAINQPIVDLVLGVGILGADGATIHGTNTEIDGVDIDDVSPSSSVGVLPTGAGRFRYRLARLGLTNGTYFLDIAAHRKDGFPYDYHHRLYQFSVRGFERRAGVYSPKSSWDIELPRSANTIPREVARS